MTAAILATYLNEYVEVGVEPLPVANIDDVVAVELYPNDVVNAYGELTAVPDPPTLLHEDRTVQYQSLKMQQKHLSH